MTALLDSKDYPRGGVGLPHNPDTFRPRVRMPVMEGGGVT
jgi:hypothetical protein